jgi:DNA-binding transcriptional LysR family regulator
MNVNLKLLHTFLLVAELRSFRRAAEESNRSQSAVSMQIRQLEQQLDVALFHRTTRSVQLTREGEMLLENARSAMDELETGLRRIKESSESQRSRLSLACVPTLAASRLPDVLASFQKSFPRVTACVRELNYPDMLDAIRSHDSDFGIGPHIGPRLSGASEFQFRPILSDPIYALIPAAMDIGSADSISLHELEGAPILMVTNSSSIYAALEEARAAARVTLDIKYEVGQVQTQIAMAAAGLGVAIVPRIALPQREDPRLRAVPIVDPPMSREICVITLRGQALPPVALRFVTMLQAMLTERVPRAPASAPPGTTASGGLALAVAGA